MTSTPESVKVPPVSLDGHMRWFVAGLVVQWLFKVVTIAAGVSLALLVAG